MADNANNSNSQMGKAVGVQQATEAAAKQAGQAPAEPDFSNMTGEEAKAYVAAQKAAKSQEPNRAADGKFASKTPSQTPNAIKDAAQEAAKKFKVKVDGQDLEVDEAELLRGYSHQKAANKILQEGKAARKQAEEFLQMMRDPEKFFEVAKKMGLDPRKLAEEHLVKQLENDMLDPRERELREAKAKLKQIEDMEKAQKEAQERQVHEALKAKYAKDYNDQFVSALKESGLPATKPMVAEMAKYISRSAKLGFKMTATEAAQLVLEDVQTAHRSLIGNTEGEMLIKLLGEEVAQKVRKYDVAKIKTPEQVLRTPAPQEQGQANPDRGRPNRRMTAKEWREFNRKK